MKIREECRIAMTLPGRMILKLCKHFRHKVAVEFDEEAGYVQFAPGECWMRAEEGGLHLRIEGLTDAELARMRFVLDDHLKRFARQPELELLWQGAAD